MKGGSRRRHHLLVPPLPSSPSLSLSSPGDVATIAIIMGDEVRPAEGADMWWWW